MTPSVRGSEDALDEQFARLGAAPELLEGPA